MSCNKNHTDKVLLGALFGGLAVGSMALFLSSKTGKELRDSSSDKARELKNKLEDFLHDISDKTQSKANDIVEKTGEYTNKVNDFASEVSEHIKDMGTEENKEKVNAFVIGSLVGGALGAGLATFMGTDTISKEDILSRFGNKTDNIKNTVREIINAIEEEPRTHSTINRNNSNVTRDVVDLVTSGVHLWQNIQNRKK